MKGEKIVNSSILCNPAKNGTIKLEIAKEVSPMAQSDPPASNEIRVYKTMNILQRSHVMRKFILTLLMLCLVLTFAACRPAGESEGAADSPETTADTEQTETQDT